ncbi:hypothetical protein BCR44DRAFT_1449593 [Catenaria anguillulae PL171]|uniref:DNA replication checkpoint mediator MRC1 domain-containing protein n=1 Tax=Catenaria anguillulae PL171 TaxID=765915 RepID=A0A1Y2H4P1_9FUNG|nr:hypothetical protein BCR44DRAFT_1449593 [Catenaria anguillulae PL171]
MFGSFLDDDDDDNTTTIMTRNLPPLTAVPDASRLATISSASIDAELDDLLGDIDEGFEDLKRQRRQERLGKHKSIFTATQPRHIPLLQQLKNSVVDANLSPTPTGAPHQPQHPSDPDAIIILSDSDDNDDDMDNTAEISTATDQINPQPLAPDAITDDSSVRTPAEHQLILRRKMALKNLEKRGGKPPASSPMAAAAAFSSDAIADAAARMARAAGLGSDDDDDEDADYEEEGGQVAVEWDSEEEEAGYARGQGDEEDEDDKSGSEAEVDGDDEDDEDHGQAQEVEAAILAMQGADPLAVSAVASAIHVVDDENEQEVVATSRRSLSSKPAAGCGRIIADSDDDSDQGISPEPSKPTNSAPIQLPSFSLPAFTQQLTGATSAIGDDAMDIDDDMRMDIDPSSASNKDDAVDDPLAHAFIDPSNVPASLKAKDAADIMARLRDKSAGGGSAFALPIDSQDLYSPDADGAQDSMLADSLMLPNFLLSDADDDEREDLDIGSAHSLPAPPPTLLTLGSDSQPQLQSQTPSPPPAARRHRQKRALAMIDKEAFESEDEFMGLGGDSDDDDGANAMLDMDADDPALIAVDTDPDVTGVNEDEIRELAKKQRKEDDEAMTRRLEQDLLAGGGGLGLGRRRRAEMAGMGYGLEDLDDDDGYGGGSARARGNGGGRRARKRAKLSESLLSLAEDPKTAAFARAFDPDMAEAATGAAVLDFDIAGDEPPGMVSIAPGSAAVSLGPTITAPKTPAKNHALSPKRAGVTSPRSPLPLSMAARSPMQRGARVRPAAAPVRTSVRGSFAGKRFDQRVAQGTGAKGGATSAATPAGSGPASTGAASSGDGSGSRGSTKSGQRQTTVTADGATDLLQLLG